MKHTFKILNQFVNRYKISKDTFSYPELEAKNVIVVLI